MFELQIKHCHTQDADAIIERLEADGALSVTLTDQEDNPILEPGPGETPLWDTSIIQALFSNAIDAQAAWDALVPEHPNLTHTLADIPHQDWVRTCLDEVKPQAFGANLWVCPSWHAPPQPNATTLMLDPGLAFGTGTHPTTSLCLTWLDSAPLEHNTIIDYGCGSGILALAALKLGVTHAYAVDIDQQALIATQSNAENNHISHHNITLSKPDALREPVDLILANILLTPLLTLEARFHMLLKNNGTLVLSGILRTQVQQLLSTYGAPHWAHHTTLHQDEWALVVFKKMVNHTT